MADEPTKEEVAEKMDVKGEADAKPAPEEGKAEPSADADKVPEKGEPDQDWKKMYGDSTKEVNENLLPKVKSYDYMMSMVDKHPELGKTWEKVMSKETGQEEAGVPAEEKTIEQRVDKMEKGKREEGIVQTTEAMQDFRTKYPNVTDSQFDNLSKTFHFNIKKYASQMSFKKAVVQSLEDEYFLQNKEAFKDEGRKEHILEQHKTDAGIVPQATSQSGGPSQKETLSPGQKSIAEKMGVKPEEAAKHVQK